MEKDFEHMWELWGKCVKTAYATCFKQCFKSGIEYPHGKLLLKKKPNIYMTWIAKDFTIPLHTCATFSFLFPWGQSTYVTASFDMGMINGIISFWIKWLFNKIMKMKSRNTGL